MNHHPQLRIERPSDGVVLLVLDNPEQRNAMSAQMTSGWVSAVQSWPRTGPSAWWW